jgi:hypothetical protein
VDPARSGRAAVLCRPGARRLAQRQQRATLGLALAFHRGSVPDRRADRKRCS